MMIQIVALRNITESNPSPAQDYISHTVVEETPLLSFCGETCPDVGDVLRINGREYTVVSREFILNNQAEDVSLGIKIRCFGRNSV